MHIIIIELEFKNPVDAKSTDYTRRWRCNSFHAAPIDPPTPGVIQSPPSRCLGILKPWWEGNSRSSACCGRRGRGGILGPPRSFPIRPPAPPLVPGAWLVDIVSAVGQTPVAQWPPMLPRRCVHTISFVPRRHFCEWARGRNLALSILLRLGMSIKKTADGRPSECSRLHDHGGHRLHTETYGHFMSCHSHRPADAR